MGVLRELFILVEHLRRIAPRAAVNPVELTAIATLRAVAASTTTVIPIIVIQGNCSLISDRLQKIPARAVNRPLVKARHHLGLPKDAARSALPWPGTSPDGQFKRV
jgi:hypothetical protein